MGWMPPAINGPDAQIRASCHRGRFLAAAAYTRAPRVIGTMSCLMVLARVRCHHRRSTPSSGLRLPERRQKRLIDLDDRFGDCLCQASPVKGR